MIRLNDRPASRCRWFPWTRVVGALRGLALAFAVLGGTARPAEAHQTLVRATPAVGDQLSSLPNSLRLVFREPIQVAFTRIALLGPDAEAVALGALQAEGDSGNVAVLAIAGEMAAGGYTVTWRTTGADGHAVEGRYTFTVLAEAVPPVPDSPAASTGRDQASAPLPRGPGSALLRVESVWYVLVRWLGFLALLGVLGAAAFLFAVLPLFNRSLEQPRSDISGQVRARAASFGRVAALTLLAAGLARLVAQGATMLTPADPVTLQWMATLIAGTIWGKGWLLQMVAGTVAWVGFRSLEHREHRGAGLLVLVAVLGLAVTPALSGHAIATRPWTGLAVAADWAHVLAAGGWIGGLAVLLLVGLPVIHRQAVSNRGPMVARLVQAFSPLALLLGGIVTGTGLVGTWLHLGSFAALWSTDYGRMLTVKLAFVAVLFVLGGINFLRVRPALGDDTGTARLRRSAGAELAIAIVVLVVTAIVVALPTARTKPHPSQPGAAAVAVGVRSEVSPGTSDSGEVTHGGEEHPRWLPR